MSEDRDRGARVARRLGLAVLAAGLLWRVVLSFAVVPAWEARRSVGSAPDRYPTLARSLVERGTLGYLDEGASPTTVRGPGFPGWLAVGIVLAGDDERWLGLWGGLPGLIAAALGAWLVARDRGVVPGIAVGAIAAAHPLPSFVAARVMGDDFYGATGLVALTAWVAALRTGSRRRALAWTVAASALLGVHLLSRSSGLLTLVAAGAVGLRPRARRVVPTLLLVGLSLAPAVAWSVRSSRLERRPVWVHSLVAYNFWLGEGFDRARDDGGPSGRYPEALAHVLRRAGLPEREIPGFWYGQLTPSRAAEMERRLTAEAIGHVRRNPAAYLTRVARGVGRYWIGGQTRTRTLEYVVLCLPVVALAALGAWTSRGEMRRGDPWPTALVLVVLLHNAGYAAVLPMARLSVQVYPELACLAGVGVWRLLGEIRRRV